MKSRFSNAVLAWFVFCASGLAQEQSELISNGKQLSVEHCSRCHVVDPSKPFTGISSTPSFKLLVNELADWEDRFASFYARLPHPSLVRFKDDEPNSAIEGLIAPVIIELDDVDAIAAYARTLLE